MSTKAEGFITKLFTKEGQGGKGPWALDNLLISDAEGEELGWFGLGFRDKAGVPPKVSEGDYILFEWEADGQYRNIVKGSATKRAADKAPERTAPAASQRASGGAQSTQANIHYQNSRTAAIELVGLLLEHDGLPITTNKAKAGQPKRFDEITAAVDQMTVKLYNDLDTFRLFETVADTGTIDTSADGDLPGDEPTDNSGEVDDEPI